MKKHDLNFKLFAVLFIVSSWISFAQQISIKGSVVDETGFPVPGANVIEKGTNKGVITDFDGNFIINGVETGATLVSVSYTHLTLPTIYSV